MRYEKQHPDKIKYRYDRDGPYKTINIHGKGRNVNISQTNIKNNLLKPWYTRTMVYTKIITADAIPALGEESYKDP